MQLWSLTAGHESNPGSNDSRNFSLDNLVEQVAGVSTLSNCSMYHTWGAHWVLRQRGHQEQREYSDFIHYIYLGDLLPPASAVEVIETVRVCVCLCVGTLTAESLDTSSLTKSDQPTA